jgi:hypothetical protein
MPEIEIKVDSETGDFTYTRSVCHASPSDPISWVANGDWAIVFAGLTPLETAEVHGMAGKKSPSRVSRTAPKGVYHYAVAVVVGHKVFLDAGCPTIVIG